MAAENENYFCMLVTPETLSDQAKAALAGRKAALLNEFRWPASSIIRVKFLESNPSLQAPVRAGAELLGADRLSGESYRRPPSAIVTPSYYVC